MKKKEYGNLRPATGQSSIISADERLNPAIKFAEEHPGLRSPQIRKLINKANSIEDLDKLRVVVAKAKNSRIIKLWQDKYFDYLIEEELNENDIST